MQNPATLAACLLLSLASTSAFAIQDCELNGESINPNNGNTTQGKTGIMKCKDRDTGQMQREQELQNGKFMGLVRYYEKGQLSKEHTVNERGNMNGRAREFAPNGNVIREATYENGSTVGLLRTFYPSGKLQRASFYPGDRNSELASIEFNEQGQLYDMRCGDKPLLAPAVDDRKLCGFAGTSQVEFYSGKGQLKSRGTFVNGEQTRREDLYDNGKASLLQETANGQRVDKRFDNDGTRRKETLWSVANRPWFRLSEQEFSDRGTLVKDTRWSPTRELLSETSFYLNGQPRSKTEYSKQGDAQLRRETSYFDSGRVAGDGSFIASNRYRTTPIGSHKSYDEQGRTVGESIYDDKGRLTREKAWDETGKLVRDDEVFEDGSRKAYAK